MLTKSTISSLRRSFLLAAGPLLLGASLASLSGCSADAERESDDGEQAGDVDNTVSAFSRLVDRICECEGCSDTTHEDYIDQYGDAQREAHNEGCDNQFGEYIACADQELECRESLAHFDGCDSEQRSYYNCIGVGTTNICPSSCSTNTAFCCANGVIECC